MTDITSQPSSPTEWYEYATSTKVTKVPLREARETNENAGIDMYRDVYFDGSSILKTPLSTLTIYTDVLAFTEEETTISPPEGSTIQINARVLTAAAPVTLSVSSSAAISCAIEIYASVIDQPITICTGESQSTALQLGPGTGNIGAVISFTQGEMTVEYLQKYYYDESATFAASLQTQLRIALALFWSHASIAISLCAHVAAVTSSGASHPLVNAQAVALGQQLAAQAMTGPGTSYAPVLVIDEYKEGLQTALVAAKDFEEQYNRSLDKQEVAEDQIKVWETMIQHANNEKSMRTSLRDSAKDKYDDASKVVDNCNKQLQEDNDELDVARKTFQEGLDKWKHEQELKAVFSILGAIFTFAFSIAEICIGDVAAAGSAEKAVDTAVEAVEDAEKLTNQVKKILQSDTLKKLGEYAKIMNKLYPQIAAIVSAAEKLENQPQYEIPPVEDITGSSQGDADANMIVTLAAWDKWILESDEQMEFAVDQSIGGASAYRLALRKHAINGKQLAQAQAETIKAGQQYVQAAMEVVLCQQDIDDLETLKQQYNNEDELFAAAAAKFFDRYMALKTSLVIELRNLVLAYRYYALEESTVVLDSDKSVADFQEDLSTITTEIQNFEERYSSDLQPFTYDVPSDRLPANYGPLMIEGLQSNTRIANFTLAPSPTPGNVSFASKFVDGSHYRLQGLEATLEGVLPQPEALEDGVVTVTLQITTSGVYSDIQGQDIFHFTSLPQVKRFSYDIDATGKVGKVRDHATFETKNHAEPTPFTQWSIKLLYPERVDLSGLTGVNLSWTGEVRYDPSRIRRLLDINALI